MLSDTISMKSLHKGFTCRIYMKDEKGEFLARISRKGFE
jgi:hypothetical protein